VALGAINRLGAPSEIWKLICSSGLVSRRQINNLRSMLSSLIYVIIITPIIIIVSFLIRQSHLLIALITLEGLILRLVLYVPVILTISGLSVGIASILLLTLGACEASLGLALLVIITRFHGSDLINNLTINKC
jgi:NADH-ubiquinone oxidoreductase chain 4L